MKNIRWILIGIGGLFVAVSVFFLGLQAFEKSQTFRGSAIEPAPLALDFELQRSDGSLFQLSDQMGSVVLIFTGYTNCPDECPATLGKYKQVAEQLDGDAAQVQFVFITVDPQRDTPDRLGPYVGSFNPNFIGLTGTLEQLQRVWNVYGGGIAEAPDANGNYEVSHSNRVWVVDKQGRLRITFPLEMSATDMAHDVQLLLAE
jgi:protein SCO1/2